jgi:integrase
MTREKLGRNLVILNGVVKCRIKRKSKFHEWTSPYQGEHAYITGKDGIKKPRPVLIKWLGECEKGIAEERWEALRSTHIRGGTPTVQEVITAYVKECEARMATTGSPVRTTITGSLNCLKRICKGAGVALSDSTAKLTPDVIDKWMRDTTGKIPVGPDRDHAVYVANSTLRQAKGVFARWLLEKYRKAGIEIPSFVLQWPSYGGVWTPKYKDPKADLKRRTIDEAEKLRAEKPKVWVLYWLIVNFGCRPGDALRLKWENFVKLPGQAGERRYLIYQPHKTKAKKGHDVTIPVPDAVWKELTTTRPRGDEPDSTQITQPHDTLRGRMGTLEELNRWMRSIGWDRETYKKAAYELRKLFTSAVRNTYGVQLASDWCGSSVQMVQQYYAATYIDTMPEIDASAVIRGTMK